MLISHKVPLPDFKDIYKQSLVMIKPNAFNQPKTILITGAQGMLGHGLAIAINKLIETGYANKLHMILSSRYWSNTSTSFWKKSPNCELINNEQIPFIEQQLDLVIHTASPSNVTKISSFEELELANLGILKKIFKLSPRKIVYISSGEVYGGGKTDEERVFNGFSKSHSRDWYPIIKLATENELKFFQKEHNLEVCVIRLFHTFGPGVKANDGRSFADVLWGATLKNEIVLKSRGEQVRTFLYLSDALDGIMILAFNQQPGFSVINLGSVNPISIYEFAKTVALIAGVKITFDYSEAFQHSPNKSIVPNVERLTLKGWKPKIELDDGIRRTIDWIKSSPRA